MWTRKELKDKAKIAFKANYWKAVLIGFVLAALVGGYSSVGSVPSTLSSATHNGYDYGNTPSSVHVHVDDPSDPDTIDIVIDDLDEKLSIQDEEGNQVEISNPDPAITGFGALFLALSFFLLFAVVFAIVLAVDAFIMNPLEVGAQRFFLRNLNQPSEAKEVAFAFDTNYKETVKGLFIRDLCIIAWTLLFIVPGIVKSYEYRMMPYLYADDPTMTKERAFAESKQMMTGQKWNAFVLDLSFLGWNILSAMTLGILGIFYVNPYQAQTNAALYEKLRYGLPAPAPAAGPQGYAPYAPNAPYAPYGQQPTQPYNTQAYAPYDQAGFQQPTQPMQTAPMQTEPMQATQTAPVQAAPMQAAAPEAPVATLQPTQPIAAEAVPAVAVAPMIVPDSQPPIPAFAAADAPAPVWDDDTEATDDEAATDDVDAPETDYDPDAPEADEPETAEE